MSIGIALAVPDGIALAADTQTTWSQVILKAKDKNTGNEFDLADPISVPVGWSKMARKLFGVDMKGKQYAVITAGEAQLNSKTMYAVVQSAAHKYTGPGDIHDVGSYLGNHLKQELAQQFSCQVNQLAAQSRKVCELVLATYESDDVAKPMIESHLIFSGQINFNGKPNNSGHILKWANHTQPVRYHGCWIGRAEFISHVVNHKNPKLPPISGQFGMMTLADAVDYTKFLVEFTCDFERFAIMVPDCGRPITSARLTPGCYQEETIE